MNLTKNEFFVNHGASKGKQFCMNETMKMNAMNRRDFLKTTSIAAVGLGTLPVRSASVGGTSYYHGLKVGLASYSVNKMSFDELVALLKNLGLRYVSLKDCHLPMSLTKEQIQSRIKKLKDIGVTAISGGVIYLKSDEAGQRRAFEYAKNAGFQDAVISLDPAALPVTEKLAREYDLRVAIHNHGPGDKHWPSALGAYERIKDLDPHVGLCVDIGHVFREGDNEVEVVRKVKDRLYDFHLKDYAKVGPGKFATRILGQGDINLKGVLKELLAQHYAGMVGLEYERFGKNEPAELKECYAALNKILGEM